MAESNCDGLTHDLACMSVAHSSVHTGVPHAPGCVPHRGPREGRR
ncbi:unnamed protein product [Gulo gulo]|uniref:Uncharacterized protein n=1 Tax=Gulo gulo TaxID=48420 RepID=A0A9X9PTY4_GULGU|nr:unnamed protein product [Gulo gulo]